MNTESVPEKVVPLNRFVAIAGSILMILFFMLCMGFVFPFKMIFHLFTGWSVYLLKLLTELTISAERTIWFLGAISLFTVGIHLSCRKWYQRNLQTRTEPAAGLSNPIWQRRWTLTLVGMLLMLVISGICIVSVTHQVYWLTTSDDVLTYRIRHMAARRSQSKNNLKQIGLAMHNYHEETGQLPSGGIFSNTGQPQHSWVSQLLPYLDRPDLYKEIDFNESWNVEVNRKPFETALPTMTNPGLQFDYDNEKNRKEMIKKYQPAHYAANSRVLSSNSNINFQQMSDGTSNTILAGEIKSNIKPWGDPLNFRDPALGINQSPQGFGSPYKVGIHFLLSDGSVRLISDKVDPEVLKALSTPNGGESVGEF